MDNKRIYCVVAHTVQAPLDGVLIQGLPSFRESTKTIVQPAGRIIAQHGHAISAARDAMLKEKLSSILSAIEHEKAPVSLTSAFKLAQSEFEPITTIVKGARDSFELYHVLYLLRNANIPVHPFYDTDQPDYGNPSYRVMTAIATEPVTPEQVWGVIDYLPLWVPQENAA